MIHKNCILALAVAGCLAAPLVAAPNVRQPLAPAWSVDLTDNCLREDGLSLSALLDRARRTRGDDAGKIFNYTVKFPAPEQAAPHGLLLEIDNGVVVESLEADGVRLAPVASFNAYWLGSERSCLLPKQQEYRLNFRVRHLTQLYPNAFGRITVRPATLNDVLTIERVPGAFDGVWIKNSGVVPETFDFNAVSSDFFGVKGMPQKTTLSLKPGERRKVAVKPDTNCWKTECYLTQNDNRSWSYINYPRSDRWFTARAEAEPLSGEWETAPGGESAVRGDIPKTGWKKADGFPLMIDPQTQKSHFFWVRTKVTVPQEWQGKELYLGVPMVHFKADFFINGKESGSLHLWETPAKFNLTGLVKPGETFELTICLTDYIAAFLPETPIPAAGIYGAPSRSLTAAVGHFPAGGIPGLKTVPELLAEPAIRTEQAVIRTHVAGGKKIETRLELRNNTGSTRDVQLHTQILKEGKELITFPPEKLTLEAGKTLQVNRTRPWNPPVLWTPETPELYELRLTLFDADGSRLDQRRERFGFREIGIAGNRFTLNGEPVRFYGFSQTTPKTMTWPAVPQPQTICRYHFHDGAYYMGGIGHVHIGDELGLFVKGENLSHNAHHGERFAYQEPITWERLFAEMKQVYHATGNSPSLAFWDIGNENNFSAPGEAKKMGDLFHRLALMDPTRPITISGAYPLPEGEAVRVLDTHGFCDLTRNTYFFLNPEKRPETMKKSGRFNRIAEGENPADWEKGRYFSPASDLHKYGKSLLHFDNLPVFFSESMYMHAFYVPGLIGDSNYVCGTNGNYHTLPALLGRRYMLRFTRKADVAATLGHVARFHGKEIAPMAAFTADQKLRFRSDEPLKLTYDLYNFISHSQDVTLQLTVKENGKTIAEQHKTVAMSPYQISTEIFDFGKFSAGENDRRFDLLIRVTGSSGALYTDWEELVVYAPLACRLPDGVKLSVFDPAGVIRNWLSERKVPFRNLSSVTDWKSGDDEYLIIAPNSLTQAEKIVALAKELRKGGKILVLEHDDVPDLTAASLKTLNYDSVGVYPAFLPESPLYGKLEPSDLRFWNSRDADLQTATRLLKQPTKGGFRILASGAYRDGIKATSAALADFSVGKGVVRYSQLNLLRSLETEPAAERFLTVLIINPPAAFGLEKFAVLATEESRRLLISRSGVAGFADSFASLKLEELKVLVADGKSLAALSDTEQSSLRRWLESGGKLLLLDAATLPPEPLKNLTGIAIKWENFALDRARFITEHPLTRGLSSGDLFWSAGKSGTNRSIPAINETRPLDPSANDPGWQIPVGEGLSYLTKPGYLAALSVGKGEVVLSTLRLFSSPVPEAERLLSSLLTNAGIHLDPVTAATGGDPDSDVRKGWDYTPISLAKFCNRAFKDDPESAIRGWAAQGSGDDLSAFPLGKQTLRGVTFDIVDPAANNGKGLIALSGTREIGILPAEVKEIPVKKKFERLVFLYGSAWGAPQFTIRVNYADRGTWIPGAPDPFVDITMRPKLEIDDWYQAETYLSGGVIMPRAKLAWAGFSEASRKRDRHIGVFLYEWDNPNPEKEIDAIDILSPGEGGSGQLFVIGISGANRRSMRPLKDLLPEYKPADLLKQLEGAKYGVVIDKNGSLPLIYRVSDGKPLLVNRRWIIQGRILKDGKPRHVFLEGAPGKPAEVEIAERKIRLRYQTKYLDLEQLITFEETGLSLSYNFQCKLNPPPETSAALILPFIPQDGYYENPVNANPLLIRWQDGGCGALSYNPEYKWHKGYYGSKEGISFTPFPNNTFEQKAESTLSLRLTLP